MLDIAWFTVIIGENCIVLVMGATDNSPPRNKPPATKYLSWQNLLPVWQNSIVTSVVNLIFEKLQNVTFHVLTEAEQPHEFWRRSDAYLIVTAHFVATFVTLICDLSVFRTHSCTSRCIQGRQDFVNFLPHFVLEYNARRMDDQGERTYFTRSACP